MHFKVFSGASHGQPGLRSIVIDIISILGGRINER